MSARDELFEAASMLDAYGVRIIKAVDALEAEVRARTLHEAADVADREGHHWSGQPALALFEFTEKLRSMAEESEK